MTESDIRLSRIDPLVKGICRSTDASFKTESITKTDGTKQVSKGCQDYGIFKKLSSRTIIHGMGVASSDAISGRQLCESHYKLSLPMLVAELSFFLSPIALLKRKLFSSVGVWGGQGLWSYAWNQLDVIFKKFLLLF